MRKTAKRIISACIAVVMIVSLMAIGVTPAGAATTYIPNGMKFFVKPTSTWVSGPHKIYAYFDSSNSNNYKWVPMEDYDNDGYYKTEFYATASNRVSFYCFDPTETEITKDNALYSTPARLYDGSVNCYSVSTGGWSLHEDNWVYFTNETDWSTVTAYFHNGNDENSTAWPGVETYLLDKNTKCYGAKAQDYEYVVFTSGKKGEHSKRFTVDELLGKYTNIVTDEIYISSDTSHTVGGMKLGSDTEIIKPTPTVSLAGTFNDWNLSSNKFTYKHGGIYHCQITLYSGEYQFKVAHNNLWYGADDTTVEYSTEKDIQISYEGGNINLISDGGVFDFYYNNTDNKLTVEFTDDESIGAKEKEIALSGSFNDWATDKIMQPLTGKEIYYPACSADQTTLNGALESIGVDNSKEYRAKIAEANGIQDYAYTSVQNTHMLDLLREGALVDPEALVTVKYTVKIAKGFHEFNIIEDGIWCGRPDVTIYDYNTPGGEVLSVGGRPTKLDANGGTYTFKYNWELNKVYVSVVYDAYPNTKANVYITGDFNDWTKDDKLDAKYYETVTKTMELKAGEYKFKIIEDDLWYGNNGTIEDSASNWQFYTQNGDCTFKAKGGKYTFSFNVRTNKLSITYDSPVVNQAELFTVVLAGDFNDWSKTANKMTVVSDTVVSTKITLEAGAYSFKVVKDALWYGNASNFTDTVTDAKLSYTAGNSMILASGGEYTFKYDVVTDKLTVTAVLDEKNPTDSHYVRLSGDFNEWSQTADEMTAISATEVSATITINSGTYGFKIIKDNLWYGNGLSFVDKVSNSKLNFSSGNSTIVASGGKYIFTYNVVSDELTVTAVLDEKDPVDNHTVKLSGSFNDWSTSEVMTKASAKTVSTTVSLSKGKHEFKIVKDSLWYGNANAFTDTTKNLSLSYLASNCIINTSGGDYTFTFDVVDNTLTITYVASVQEDPAKTADVIISGDFNDWSVTSDKFSYYSTNKVAAEVSIPTGSYKFKVVYESLWYGSDKIIENSTSSDVQLDYTATECTINANGGEYTFIFDVVTKQLKVTAKVSETDFAKTAVAYVAGDFNNWNMDKMEYYDKNTLAVTIDVPAGSHLFKVVQDDLWYGNGGEIFNDTSYSGAVELSYTAKETKLHAKGGKYTFMYNVVNHTLEVTHKVEEIDYASGAKVFLVGDFNDWNTSNTPMKASTYTTTTVDYYLDAGSYNFKIYHDGNWYGNSGTVITDTVTNLATSNTATDILLKATGSGTYTFTYNVVNNSLTITYSPSDLSQSAKICIAGQFNDWSENDALTYKGSGVFSVTKTLSAGTYCFKMINNGAWYGNDGIINNTTTTTSSIGWGMDCFAGDCTLKADGGSYTFNYNANTNFLEVVYNG